MRFARPCNRRATGRRLGPRSFTLATIAAALSGCATPPSVTPLLRVAEEAVRAEARRVEADAA